MNGSGRSNHEPNATTSGGAPGEFGLSELTEAAGVSVRTVRYYIAEGLLPPPVGGGARSAYTTGHLDRLRLINRLKAAYLPLKEIRRQLAGLDDVAVRRAVDELTAQAPEEQSAMSEEGPVSGDMTTTAAAEPMGMLDSAAAYVANVLRAQTASGPDARSSVITRGSSTSLGRPGSLHPRRPPTIRATEPPPDTESGTWRRIPLGEDAELLVREDAYHRKRDRVEWLVRWARKVFD